MSEGDKKVISDEYNETEWMNEHDKEHEYWYSIITGLYKKEIEDDKI